MRALLLVLVLGLAGAPEPGPRRDERPHHHVLPPRRPALRPEAEAMAAVHKISEMVKNVIPGGFRFPPLRSPFFGSMHMFRPGPPQQITETHPTPHEVQRTVRWPICVFNRAALLGTFCVDKTTSLMEKDPANLLPRISFNVEPGACARA